MVVRRCVYCKRLIDPRKYYYLGSRCTDICQECGDRLKAGLSPLEPQLHFMDLETAGQIKSAHKDKSPSGRERKTS